MQFTELLNKYQIPYATEGNHHCRRGWVQIDCPYCGRDTNKFHMGFNLTSQSLNCWRCGPHHALKTLSLITNEGWNVLKELMGDLYRLEKDREVQHTGKLSLPGFIKNLDDNECYPHREYLEKVRKFDTAELMAIWRIQGIAKSDRLQWRLFIPIYLNGYVVSWTTRSISNKVSVRYVSASPNEESVPHRSICYGQDYVGHTAIICEGPTDVWRVGPGAVATLGTSVSKSQIRWISTLSHRIICFDTERTAQERARKLCDQLSCFAGETTNIILDSNDPGSATKKEINTLRRLLK